MRPGPNPEGDRQHGERRPNPKTLLTDEQRWPSRTETILFKNGIERELDIKVVHGVCWYATAGRQAVQVVLVHDPLGQWRDEASGVHRCHTVGRRGHYGLLSAVERGGRLLRGQTVVGFPRSTGMVCESVERAAPMAWFVGTLVVCWYAWAGQHGPQAQRHRPWYKHKETPTFADMLAACRLQLWQEWLRGESGSEADVEEKRSWLLEYVATSN